MTSLRENYQSAHAQWLAGWAVTEENCGGRKFTEPDHPYRTCFQRDRDRIIHCSAFRRLDFKTQVFVPHEHDHYRTRLTHTLEVAQVARSLGRALKLNEDLIEAVALAHDLGHPPFGHTGEHALDKLMSEHGGFEHNRQSLRLADYLEHPYPEFRGLNLTRVVRECLAKHETRYDHPVSEEFDTSTFAPMEGQLADSADEIAYTCADLDDSLAAGLITVEQLSDFELWRNAWSQAETATPQARAIHKRIRACKGVLANMADDLIATTTRNIEAMKIACPDDVRNAPRKCVTFSDTLAPMIEQVQNFLLNNVYLAGESGSKEQAGEKIIRQLFNAYIKNPTLLPTRYQKRIDTDSLHRTICDYIAGMTDRFCKQTLDNFK